MTNQPTANQSNTNKEKKKEENPRDDNTEVAYKDAGHCSRNTHNLLLGLTVMGMHGHTHAMSWYYFVYFCLMLVNIFSHPNPHILYWLNRIEFEVSFVIQKIAICASAHINMHNCKCPQSSMIIFPWDILGLLLSLVCFCKHLLLHSCVPCPKKPCKVKKLVGSCLSFVTQILIPIYTCLHYSRLFVLVREPFTCQM